jgi:multidrug transporter EmrE-like cation transporter
MLLWFGVLAVSVAFDVGATAYLKVAGERLQGLGFLSASVLGVVAFAPSIITYGYAIKIGPSFIATIGIWAVGVYAANAIVGVLAFGDGFDWRTVAGIMMACVTVVLLKPTGYALSTGSWCVWANGAAEDRTPDPFFDTQGRAGLPGHSVVVGFVPERAHFGTRRQENVKRATGCHTAILEDHDLIRLE